MRLSLGLLDEIWIEIGKVDGGAFQANPPAHQPKRLADDAAEQVMSVPNEDGSERELYRRKPGQPWEVANWVPAAVSR